MRSLNIRRVGILVLMVIVGVVPGETVTAMDTPPDASKGPAVNISTENFVVTEGQVSLYETFADLLAPHGVDADQAVRVARATRSMYDSRDIQVGKTYWVYVNPWLQQARYLVYEIDPLHLAVYDLQNPDRSRLKRRPVERKWRTIEGTVESTIYETLVSNDAHPELALQLSEVFAWQLDFFRVRRGDAFEILYERRVADGERVPPGDILAACLTHQGEEYCAFRFDDGEGPQYFNPDGQSLHRSILKAPLRFTRISSRYSRSRYHPVLKRRRPHLGTDYAAPTGTPVHAVGAGTVVKAGYYGNNGNYVKIRHNGTYTSGYLHLSTIADGVVAGAKVEQGETIGYVGSTGLSTGPHLDYRLWERGEAVDPFELELPPTRSVNPSYRAAFERLVEDRLQRLRPPRGFPGELYSGSADGGFGVPSRPEAGAHEGLREGSALASGSDPYSRMLTPTL